MSHCSDPVRRHFLFLHRQGELCTYECDEGHHRDSDTKDCLNCDTACATCDGPTASSCIACKHHRVYVEDSVEVDPGDIIRRGDLSVKQLW